MTGGILLSDSIMNDNEEVHVPSTNYENPTRIVHNTDRNFLLVKTNGMGRSENANQHLLPEVEDEEHIDFEEAIGGYVGGVERLSLSAFSEDEHEVLAFVDSVTSNANGQVIIDFSSSSNVLPSVRFREKHGELQAVVTHRSRL